MNTKGMLIDPNLSDEELYESESVSSIFSQVGENIYPKVGDMPLLKYIAYIYDKNSPIRLHNVKQRKVEALDYSGLQYRIEEILDMKDDKAIFFASAYLRTQRDVKWAALRSNEDFLWQCQEALLSNEDSLKDLETKQKLSNSIDTTIDKIEKYKAEIFGDNKESVDEIVNFRVEDYARDLALALQNK
jgi:uncharacterized protein YlzI (FlbEa/FlbD family)